ncbi:hypothetical protein Pint_22383 [Pistacia integerrima]|uniref:Uncharacterized protein n=1 Tax=Pistacia integerrima TaxID=434235 RepID=A0ACC0YIA0_9ROSI|nr:hypothetical protein Pint_22383 [Pistacia integerrima]
MMYLSETQEEEEEELIPLIQRQNNDSEINVPSPEIGDSYNIDIEPNNSNIEHGTHSGTYRREISVASPDQIGDSYNMAIANQIIATLNMEHIGGTYCWSRKVSLEWIFVITNFVIKLPSAVLDQLSSAHKARYELFAMLLSIVAFFICIIELTYKGRKGQFISSWRRRLPWFYNASQNYKPFGSFRDFVGSVCALCQCIVTAINYAQTDSKLIDISSWPIICAFGLVFSKMLENSADERRNE